MQPSRHEFISPTEKRYIEILLFTTTVFSLAQMLKITIRINLNRKRKKFLKKENPMKEDRKSLEKKNSYAIDSLAKGSFSGQI